ERGSSLPTTTPITSAPTTTEAATATHHLRRRTEVPFDAASGDGSLPLAFDVGDPSGAGEVRRGRSLLGDRRGASVVRVLDVPPASARSSSFRQRSGFIRTSVFVNR